MTPESLNVAVPLVLERLEDSIRRGVDLSIPLILPKLYKKYLEAIESQVIDSEIHCPRHDGFLGDYIDAQKRLTRAKRMYLDDLGVTQAQYLSSLRRRDEVRKLYRASPCTCALPHR